MVFFGASLQFRVLLEEIVVWFDNENTLLFEGFGDYIQGVGGGEVACEHRRISGCLFSSPKTFFGREKQQLEIGLCSQA